MEFVPAEASTNCESVVHFAAGGTARNARTVSLTGLAYPLDRRGRPDELPREMVVDASGRVVAVRDPNACSGPTTGSGQVFDPITMYVPNTWPYFGRTLPRSAAGRFPVPCNALPWAAHSTAVHPVVVPRTETGSERMEIIVSGQKRRYVVLLNSVDPEVDRFLIVVSGRGLEQSQRLVAGCFEFPCCPE